MEIKKVGAASIPIIRQLANIAWPVTYKAILLPDQSDYMMELMYSEASLQKQMEKGHQFIVAFDEQQPVAFASYATKETNTNEVFTLQKIYILPHQQGKGIGKILLEYILDDIMPKGARGLELNVNRCNKALGFYKKRGFEIIGQQDIPIGNGYFMNDYIMKLSW